MQLGNRALLPAGGRGAAGARPQLLVPVVPMASCHSRSPLLSLQPAVLQPLAQPPRAASVDPTTAPDQQTVSLTNTLPGDLVSLLSTEVQVAIQQPRYTVQIMYRSGNRPLKGAQRCWAHIGHSGWRDTLDVELTQAPNAPEVWTGTYSVPSGRLSTPWHAEVQMVFKGIVNNIERYDNNGGANWSVSAELVAERGLVAGLNPCFSSTRTLVSSLLLRVESLCHKRLLTPEQASLLHTMAWQRDLTLMTAYQQVQHNDDRDVARSLISRCEWLRPPSLHVVHIASEMAPIAKVGGLADVVTSLAKAHQCTGTLVEIIVPKYDCIHYGEVKELRQMTEIHVPWGAPGVTVRTVVWCGLAEGLPVFFIEPHSSEKYFWRKSFYGEPDDAVRFSFFSRAALEFLARRSHRAPDIIHAHDWQAAAVVPLLKETYRPSALSRTKAVLTIHNMAFQGFISASFLTHMGISTRYHHLISPDVMLHSPGHDAHTPPTLSLLKGGIVYADRVTTVSPTYGREVLTPQFGFGLQGVLQKHSYKFAGVLNGIDHETWDPASDPLIPAHFSADDTSGKEACKQALLRELGLPYCAPGSDPNRPAGRPLLAIVSRLTDQKGLHLITAGVHAAMRLGAQVVVLGSAPDRKVQTEWEGLARDFGRGGDGRVVLRHDEGLSHRIFAASDMLLVPSMFEPCGLTQLIALRYGTIPVVRTTGGLADTVRDVAHYRGPDHEKNGFTFSGTNVPDVEHAIKRACDAYTGGNQWWRGELVPRAMRQDWSWSRSAQSYLELYNWAVNN